MQRIEPMQGNESMRRNESMNDNANFSVGDMLRSNPLGAAMIGAGLFWMFAGARTSEAMLGAARAVSDADLPLSPSRMAETATDMASAVSDAARRSANVVTENASAMMRGDRAQSAFAAFDSMRESMGRMFAAQPLMIAATGLAVGAAIAATIPATQIEASVLGDKADELKRQASDLVSRGAQEAKATLSDLASSAQQQAQAHGVDAGAIVNRAEDMARQAGKDAGLI